MQIAEDAHDSGGNRDGADHHLRGKRGARKQTRPTTTPLCTWPSWGRNGLLPGASAITVGLLSAGAHASAPFPGNSTRTGQEDRKSTRLNSSHMSISYAVFCLKKKKKKHVVRPY